MNNHYDKIEDVKNPKELDSLLENERVDLLTQMAKRGSRYARSILYFQYGLGELNVGQDQFYQRGEQYN